MLSLLPRSTGRLFPYEQAASFTRCLLSMTASVVCPTRGIKSNGIKTYTFIFLFLFYFYSFRLGLQSIFIDLFLYLVYDTTLPFCMWIACLSVPFDEETVVFHWVVFASLCRACLAHVREGLFGAVSCWPMCQSLCQYYNTLVIFALWLRIKGKIPSFVLFSPELFEIPLSCWNRFFFLCKEKMLLEFKRRYH